MTIWLVRHTTVCCSEGICYGATEVPLAESFFAEAAAVRAQLPAPPWKIHSSPSARCRRLAEYLGEPVLVDRRLGELAFGLWEGRPWHDIPRPEIDHWAADYVSRSPPSGETFAAIAARTASWANDAIACGGITIAVTHAGVIRALAAVSGGHRLETAFDEPVNFGCVRPLIWPPRSA